MRVSTSCLFGTVRLLLLTVGYLLLGVGCLFVIVRMLLLTIGELLLGVKNLLLYIDQKEYINLNLHPLNLEFNKLIPSNFAKYYHLSQLFLSLHPYFQIE